MTLHALDQVELSFGGFSEFPQKLAAPEVRRQAILHRADILGALSDYAASQSALQLEVAKQYPDLHLGPGYSWNSGSAGDSQWQLGLTVELPILNQNQGPIAEAEARRAVAAAQFLAVQAKAIGAIDRALEGYQAAVRQSATAAALLENLQKQQQSVRANQAAGAADALAVAAAGVEFNSGALLRLDALVKAQQALAQLEDAVQSPLVLPDAVIQNAQVNPRDLKENQP